MSACSQADETRLSPLLRPSVISSNAVLAVAVVLTARVLQGPLTYMLFLRPFLSRLPPVPPARKTAPLLTLLLPGWHPGEESWNSRAGYSGHCVLQE